MRSELVRCRAALALAVVSIAACAWPAHRATRVTTATALAYE